MFFRESYGISQVNLNVIMKTRWEGQLKKKPKSSVISYAVEQRFLITLFTRRRFALLLAIMICLRFIFLNLQMILRSSIPNCPQIQVG